METITDHKALIDALGGNKAVAGELDDCTPVRVGQWKLGNRIPVEYWTGIIDLAREKGLAFVDSDWMMQTYRPRIMPDSKATDAHGEAA